VCNTEISDLIEIRIFRDFLVFHVFPDLSTTAMRGTSSRISRSGATAGGTEAVGRQRWQSRSRGRRRAGEGGSVEGGVACVVCETQNVIHVGEMRDLEGAVTALVDRSRYLDRPKAALDPGLF
jgi:hypothetical protein